MKMINIKRKELKRIINDLKKASVIFDGFGCWLWDMMSEDDKKRYNDAEWLLTISMRKLKKVRGYKKKTI